LENTVFLDTIKDYSYDEARKGIAPLQVSTVVENELKETYSYWDGVTSYVSQACLKDELILRSEYDDCGRDIVPLITMNFQIISFSNSLLFSCCLLQSHFPCGNPTSSSKSASSGSSKAGPE
jgi:hypothetical protein